MCHASSSNTLSSLPQQSLHVPRVFLKHVIFVTSTASACATRSFLKHVIFVTSTVSACATCLPQTRYLRYLNEPLHVPRVFLKHVIFVTSTVSACATCLPQTRYLRYLNSLCMCHVSSSNTLSSLPQQCHATGNTGMSNITGQTGTGLAMGKTNWLGTFKQTYEFLFQLNPRVGRCHNWNGLNDLFGAYELTVIILNNSLPTIIAIVLHRQLNFLKLHARQTKIKTGWIN